MAKQPSSKKIVAQNRRAKFDYVIHENLEAGIVLRGSEVKSLRKGQASITEAYAGESGDELYLFNAFIPEYLEANRFNHSPRAPRKLLIHKRQLNKWLGAIRRKGATIVPTAIYFNERGRAKVDLGLASGKKQMDKRATEKERDWQRDKARIMREKLG